MDEQTVYIRRVSLELAMWRNRHSSLERTLSEAESFEYWILRDRKAELHMIKKDTP